MYKMLIVDDEPLTRRYFLDYVERLDAEWTCAGEAADGEEALALLDAGGAYDLVVTDIRMPGMSGLELARRLHARPGAPHVVVLSGHDEFTLAKEAMEYGVHAYLLKPVVKEEVVDMLRKLAARLSAERMEEAAYRSLLSLSSEAKAQVARNVLRAIITENHMEIKVLYPMLHRLKITLMEAEGAMLAVALDESQLLERGVSYDHMTLYRYIVHQTAAELAASGAGGGFSAIPFADDEQRTVLFVPGDDADDALRRCRALYKALADAVRGMTGLRLWGAVGEPEMELLQLGASYRQAAAALRGMLFAEEAASAEPLVGNEAAERRWRRLDGAVAALMQTPAEGRDAAWRASLQSIAEELEPIDRRRFVLFGAHLLRQLSGASADPDAPDRSGPALQALLRRAPADAGRCPPEEAAAAYRDLLAGFEDPASGGASREGDEHEIVARVKAYILERYAEPLSLAHLAELMGLSPGYLSSLFHQRTQESYIKFLTRVRMEHAAAMLRRKPPEKVYDVAEKVGYLSVKHFSYVFKQHYGVPPGQYQEKAMR